MSLIRIFLLLDIATVAIPAITTNALPATQPIIKPTKDRDEDGSFDLEVEEAAACAAEAVDSAGTDGDFDDALFTEGEGLIREGDELVIGLGRDWVAPSGRGEELLLPFVAKGRGFGAVDAELT